MKLTSITPVPEKPTDWKWLRSTITLCVVLLFIIIPGIFIQQWIKKDTTATKVLAGTKETIPVEQTTWGDWGMILLLFVAVGLVLYLAYKETRSSGALSWVEVMKTPAWLTLVGVVVVNIILALTLYPIWLIFWDYGPIFWAVNLGAVIIAHFVTKESRGAKIAARTIAFILLIGIALPIWKDYRRGNLTQSEYATKVAIDEVVGQEEVVKQLVACDPILKSEREAKQAIERYRSYGLYELLKVGFRPNCLTNLSVKSVELAREIEVGPDAWSEWFTIPTTEKTRYRIFWHSQDDYVVAVNEENLVLKKDERIDGITASRIAFTGVDGKNAKIRIWMERK